MYRDEYPKANDIIVVQVKSIAEHGAYCSLLEYNKIEGMILMSELSRRRIRSINRLIRVGRQEIVVVLRVNEEKGYIDLSKKRVIPSEVIKVEERWNKSKAVHSILRHVAKECNYGVGQLYESFAWNLSDKFGHAYDGLKWALSNKDEFLKSYNVPKDIINVLFKNIENRMKPQQVKIISIIELTCFTKIGINGIKKALKQGLKLNDDDFIVKITLDKPPLYRIDLNTLNYNKGIERINKIIQVIKNEIIKHGGYLKINQSPKKVDNKH